MKLIKRRKIDKPKTTWNLHIKNNNNYIANDIIVSNCHQVKATSLNAILQECSHMEYKIGCTGTLPDNRLDNLTIKSYLGPVVKQFPVRYLIDNGYLSECYVKCYHINYTEEIKGNFNEVKDQVFVKPFRMNLISNIIKSVKDENILLLVGKIDKEGKVLEEYLKSLEEFKDHQIFFMWGKIKKEERELWRQKCINENKIIIIAVWQLFQLGINIPNLNHIILASSNKSKIRTLQTIGRELRKGDSDKAYLYDIVDNSNKFLPKHYEERLKYYNLEEFPVKDIILNET